MTTQDQEQRKAGLVNRLATATFRLRVQSEDATRKTKNGYDSFLVGASLANLERRVLRLEKRTEV